MGVFVEQYGVVRWGAVIAFCLAAALVTGRLGTVRPGMCAGSRADRESDAAHLVMCLVMLGMLVFPTAADPHAVRAVLTAMVVVYTLLLGDRMLRWRNGIRDADLGGGTVAPFAYHLVAAAAMLYAMSGHGPHEHAGHGPAVPAPGPVLALAALFAVDAAAMAVPAVRRRLPRVYPHPVGAAGSWAVVPHLVMDLGTAYMLVAAAAG
ncbi:DUF5134 domain-containing protein [Nocardia niigatensis]|uniref:DUF5134 domain-containing protein n=1 Tax=Nocardia niigatensis TaxID=209249 RepID=UPI0002F4AB21|nr:DUF5134 domain-containing protein [Nocardia niigatensis]